MSDSDTPQPNPEPDHGARDPSPAEPVGNGSPAQPAQSSASSAGEPPSSDGAAQPTPSAVGGGPLGRVMQVIGGRRGAWAAAVAALCVVAGIVASVLGAHAVARNDAASGRRAFQQTSTSIASTLKLAIRHEEQLVVSATTFLAGHANAFPAEFGTWVNWARTTHRYPELDQLTLLMLVRAPELTAYQARLAGHTVAVKPLRETAGTPVGTAGQAGTATPAGGSIRIVPASDHHYYCLALADLSRSAAVTPPTGFDYCARTPALLLSRDAGVGIYSPVSAGHTGALEVMTPVYRGYVTPHTVAGREAASVGWLREVLVPGVVLRQALAGQPGYALRLRHQTGSASVVFTSGPLQPGAQSAMTSFHNGWTVRTFGPAAGGGVFTDGSALALLIGGCLLSVLLGVLVFVLGAGRTPTPAPKTSETHDPREDLYDALTGLPNRALMLDRAERMLARAGRQSEIVAGALSVEIDWVKDVNEKLGRAAGDQLLKVVAKRLQDVIRTGDTVGRLGGDEFVILVESAARGIRLDSLARRVIEALHEPVELDGFGPSFVLAASIGIAFGRYTTPDDLLRDAHLAAKAAGKDRYTLFNANMRSVVEGQGVLEAELNTALGEDQFFLLYEPIRDLGSRRIVGLEALVRWQHPERGILVSDDFIPLAEETGLIVPIGRWALERACSQAAAWNVAGHRIGVSVPVSTNQLNREGFATDVRRALQQSGIEPVLLTLEITEAAMMRNVGTATERLQELKQLGVRIALDDFGSAYASHADLQRLPLDFLRVDRSTLAASDTEEYRSWLLETILVAGRDLSLRVIAKGIETSEQMTALQTMGCSMAQGPFMGEPTPVDAVESLLGADPAAAQTPHAPSPSLLT